MPKEFKEGSIDQAVARMLKETEVETPETPEEHEPDYVEEETEEETQQEPELEEDEEYEEEEQEAPSDTEEESEYEEETEEEEQEEEEAPSMYSVKIDGEEYEVSLDELTSGYQRQKDYTKKTQAVAEARAEVDNAKAQLTAQQEQFAEAAVLANELMNRDLAKYSNTDWDALQDENPAEFLKQQTAIQRIKRDQEELQGKYRQMQEQQLATQQEAAQAALASEKPKVLAAFPEWKDNDKAQAHYRDIMSYAEKSGYSADELGRVFTARDLTMLDKARQFDAIKETKKRIVKKKKPVIRKVTKQKGVAPKSVGTKKRLAESKQRLRGSGSIDDAAALLMERSRARR
jgi:hypothetical protein